MNWKPRPAASMRLTSAISAGGDKIAKVDYQAAQQYMDHIFLMSYDFSGAFDLTNPGPPDQPLCLQLGSGHQVHHRQGRQGAAGSGGDTGQDCGGAPYGRGWTGVKNGYQAGSPFTGTAPTGPVSGTWEMAWWITATSSTTIMGAGWEQGYDRSAEAPYVFKASGGDLTPSTTTARSRPRPAVRAGEPARRSVRLGD